MRSINTEIDIAASPETVWRILMDFPSFVEWNPFVAEIEGEREVGKRLRAVLMLGTKRMPIKPRVTAVEQNRLFQWLGSTGFKGIFDGRHSFRLNPNEEGTRFEHFEQFTGILAVPMLGMIGKKTRNGFEAMNRAIKERAEAVGS